MSERSGGRERSEHSGASEQMSDASEQANGRASGPVPQSVFLAVIDHSAMNQSTHFASQPYDFMPFPRGDGGDLKAAIHPEFQVRFGW